MGEKGRRAVGALLLTLGLMGAVGAGLVSVLVPFHRDGSNCGPTFLGKLDRGQYPKAESGAGVTQKTIDDCYTAFKVHAFELGGIGIVGVAVAVVGARLGEISSGVTARAPQVGDADGAEQNGSSESGS